jgi:hypothetical protein
MPNQTRKWARLGVQRLEDRSVPTVNPTHLYTFDANVADQYGGPALVADGGTVAGGRYTFGANQGLRLINGLADTSTYSVAMTFEVDSLSPFFKKVIDFQDLTSGNGLYLVGAQLQLYPGGIGQTSVSANTDCKMVLVRDGSTGITSIYLNGVLEQAYSDFVSSVAVPSTNVLRFFEGGFFEVVGGSVDVIAMYDQALSASDVAELAAGATHVTANQTLVQFNEGSQATNSGTWSNAAFSPVTLSASVGNITTNANGTWSWSFDTNDGPDQSQTVTITASSTAGDVSTSFQLLVNNLAPSVTSTSATVSVLEGEVANNGGFWSDVGLDAVSLTASVGDMTKTPDGSWSWSFATQNGPVQSQTVTITATDSDGASSSTTFALVVNNVAPTISAISAGDIDANGNLNLSGTFSDPGLLDSHTVTVNWGDSSPVDTLSNVTSGSFNGLHHYSSSGSFTITVTVADNNGDSDTKTATATSTITAGVQLVNGILSIVGTSNRDRIRIQSQQQGPNHVPVYKVTAVFNWGLPNQFTYQATFYACNVQQIVIMGNGGDDVYQIDDDINVIFM